MSKFYGVGVGPGDPELLTLKACRTLKQIDILVTPHTKCGSDSLALSIAKPHLDTDLTVWERVFPMSTDPKVLEAAWDAVADEIQAAVLSGKSVGFITLGDPMTYSTYIYLLARLRGKVPTETQSGITSYQGLSAEVQIPLVEGDTPLVIVPCTAPMEDLKEMIRNNDSLVLMKLSKHFREIIDFLIAEGLEEHTSLVSFATQPEQRIYNSLKDIKEDKISYFSTILINKRWTKI